MPKEIHSEGDGDLSKRLVVASQDEIGKMAIYFNQFIEKLGGIIRKITDTASSVATSATELSIVSSETAQNVQIMSGKTSMVASAAEESSINTSSVAASMEEASINLSSVASVTEAIALENDRIEAPPSSLDPGLRSILRGVWREADRLTAVLDHEALFRWE
jgi:methyl-accepting chemotaxis protein